MQNRDVMFFGYHPGGRSAHVVPGQSKTFRHHRWIRHFRNEKDSKQKTYFRVGVDSGLLGDCGFLSMAVFTTLQFLLFEVSHTNSRANAFLAEQLAHSAAAVAINPAVLPNDPILNAQTSEGSYSASIISEGGKLPLNQFLTRERREVLDNLFLIWGMEKQMARQVVDEMLDWIDPDSVPTGAGKERGYYFSKGQRHFPLNRPFRSLEEVTLIESYSQILEANRDWRSSFTLRSSGKLDVNTAPADLIAAVCGCSLTTAERFVETRSGRDGIPLNEDDLRMESVDQALDLLATYGDDREIVGSRFSIDDSVKRIVARGTVGDVTVEQIWVVQNRSSEPQILDFSTRQLRNE